MDQNAKDKLDIVNEWKTDIIDPHEIAKHLRGELKESNDLNFSWNVYLRYGLDAPVLILKLEPGKKEMHVVTPAPDWHGYGEYRSAIYFRNVESLHFYQYRNSDDEGIIEIDISINVRDSGSGLIAAAMVISSWQFRVRSYEIKRQK